MTEFGVTVDRHDIDRFAALSANWWDPRGSFRPLHQINPMRIDFIRRELIAHFGRDERSLSPFAGLSLADIGCGGGLVAEPMARLGFAVTAIDATAEAIAAARSHADASRLAIDYRPERTACGAARCSWPQRVAVPSRQGGRKDNDVSRSARRGRSRGSGRPFSSSLRSRAHA